MRIKPEDLRKIAEIFYSLTVNKYKIYAVKVHGTHDMDLSKEANAGIDQLIEKSLMAAINSVLSNQKPEILPPSKKVKLLTYEGKGKKFNPCANDLLWAESTKRVQ